jgi:hypothetical protein
MYKFLEKLDSIDRKLNTVATYRGSESDAPLVKIPHGIIGLPRTMQAEEYRLTAHFASELAYSAAGISLYRFVNDFHNPYFTVIQDTSS